MPLVKHRQEPKDLRKTRRVGCRLRVMNGLGGMVTDICEDGARFSFHHTVSLNEDFDVPIKIADRIIWARVHPVWVQPSPEPQLFDLGASFATLADEDRDAIRQYVRNRLRTRPFDFLSRLLRRS